MAYGRSKPRRKASARGRSSGSRSRTAGGRRASARRSGARRKTASRSAPRDIRLVIVTEPSGGVARPAFATPEVVQPKRAKF